MSRKLIGKKVYHKENNILVKGVIIAVRKALIVKTQMGNKIAIDKAELNSYLVD